MKFRKKYLSYLIAFSMVLNTSSATNLKPTQKELNKKIYLESLEEQLADIEIEYNYAHFYPQNKLVEEILKEKEERICNNKSEDWQNLNLQIIENSRNEKESIFLIAQTKELEQFSAESWAVALKLALQNCFQNKQASLEDICHIQTIKIIQKNLENKVLARYIPALNSIYVDEEHIYQQYQVLSSKNQISLEKYLAYVLEHELNHCREFSCECGKECGTTIASYHIGQYLIEAAAESEIYNLNPQLKNQAQSIDFSYYDYRKEEALLFFLVLFKEENLEGYYEVIFASDFNRLLSYLEVESEEEIKSLVNILYSIDAMTNENSLSYYLKEQYGNIYNEEEIKELIGFSYRLEIYKLTLQKFISEISKGNLTLQETLYLQHLIKNMIFANTPLLEETYLKNNSRIEENLIQLDKVFNAYIENYYQITSNVRIKIEAEGKSVSSEQQEKLIQKYPLLETISWTLSETLTIEEENFTRKKELIP